MANLMPKPPNLPPTHWKYSKSKRPSHPSMPKRSIRLTALSMARINQNHASR